MPIVAHCSRRGVHYRGTPPPGILSDPETGQPLPAVAGDEPITRLADPDNYLPILSRHPNLKLCLAHFGAAATLPKRAPPLHGDDDVPSGVYAPEASRGTALSTT